MILCDIGNSTYHFKTRKKTFKISVNDSIESLPEYEGKVYFLSVNKKARRVFLKK